MRISSFIFNLYAFLKLSLSASIHHSDMNINNPMVGNIEATMIHSSANSESISISNSFNDFQNELNSVFSFSTLKESGTSFEQGDDILIIPKSQINERNLNLLGFKDLVKYSKKFKLSNNVFNTHLDILVPEMTLPYFVFNTTDSLKLPKDHTNSEYSKFLESSAPFELPDFASLVDYFLVLPIPQSFNSNLMRHSEVISTKSSLLPIFKHSNKPSLVFLFKSGNDSLEAKDLNLSLLNVKKYLGSKELNQFFDTFAKTWIQGFGISDLVHGSFCTLNLKDKNDSFCIKVREDLRNLMIFPVFNQQQDSSPKFKREPNPLLNKGNQSPHEDKGLSYLTLPLSLLKANGTENVDTYSPRGKGYTQVISRSKAGIRNPGIHLQKRKQSDDEFTKAKVEDIRFRLEHRLKQKQLKDKHLKSKSTHLVSNIQPVADGQADTKTEIRASIIKTPSSSTPKSKLLQMGSSVYDSFVEDKEKEVKEWEAKRKKQTIERIKSATEPVQSTVKINNPEDCEQITWFNVFHHSVFGKTKFCGVD